VQLKMQKAKEKSVSGQHTAQQPPPFTPHDLTLQPGDVVTGVDLSSSSSSSSSSGGSSSSSDGSNAAASYRLGSEVHRGPRSAVWRAAECGPDTPLALKVMLANHNELSAVLAAVFHIGTPKFLRVGERGGKLVFRQLGGGGGGWGVGGGFGG
jgi:hypothetical protein